LHVSQPGLHYLQIEFEVEEAKRANSAFPSSLTRETDALDGLNPIERSLFSGWLFGRIPKLLTAPLGGALIVGL
jgi:hypothetical protein